MGETTISTSTEPLRSDYILGKIIDELGITAVKTSAYKEYTKPDGDVLRVRLSNHGVILSNWHNRYSGSTVSLENSDNVAITIMPNRTECEEKGINFPPPIINKTSVRISKDSKEEIDYSFFVMHYLYRSWKITEDQITLIVGALKEFINGNGYNDPLKDTPSKADVFKDTSNKPYEKIKESNTRKDMKNTITESQLRNIIAESVKTIIGNQQAYNDCLKVGDLRKMISQLDDDDTVVFVDGERRAHHFVVNATIRRCRWQKGLSAYSQLMHEEPIKALYIQMEA